jgi:hypothetical protein
VSKSFRMTALAVAAAGLFLCLVQARADAATPPARYARFPADSLGSGAGQILVPRALATDPRTGNLYVLESGNRRVSEYSPWGAFIRAFGMNVAPGSVNERQEIHFRATGGKFDLSFGGAATPELPFDADAEEVEASLDALPAIAAGGGGVTVEANPGNQVPGVTPSIYYVAFTAGPLAGTDVEQLAASEGTDPLTGGEPSSGLEVRTVANGTPGGTGIETCTSESGCLGGVEGGAIGEFKFASGIDVDSAGDVYVLDQQNNRVQKFDSAGEFVLEFGGEVDKTTGAAVCTAESGDTCGAGVEGTGPGFFSPINQFIGDYMAIGTGGTVYVADKGRIEEFNPDGSYKGEISLSALHAENPAFPEAGDEGPKPLYPGTLAFDPTSGDLLFARALVRQSLVEIFRVDAATGRADSVWEYQLPPHGADSPPPANVEGIAPDSAGNVFVALSFGAELGRVVEFGAAGEVLIGNPALFAAVDSREAKLSAVATDSLDHVYVSEVNVGLKEDAIDAFGTPPLALAPPPRVAPSITDQLAVAIGSTTATLAAKINPQFFTDTHYYVEYGPSSCGASSCVQQPAAPGTLLTDEIGNSPLSGSVTLSGLAPGTTYHYRFVAQSSGGGPSVGLSGRTGEEGEGTFTTAPVEAAQPPCPGNEAFRFGPAAFLPDCRAYEMVSPIDKNGADVSVVFNFLGDPAGLDQAAPTGESLTYSAYRAFGDAESSPYTSQYLAQRSSGGWTSRSISPPLRGPAVVSTIQLERQYMAFTSDLCSGWLLQPTGNALAPGSIPGSPNLYRRDICGGGYETLAPLTGSLDISSREFEPEIQGFSADGSKTIFIAPGKLTANATAGAVQLYESSGGAATLVCILPNETAFAGGCSAGTFGNPAANSHGGRGSNVTHAISEDGSTIYWSTSANGEGRIYVRLAGATTLPVSNGIAHFWAAAADGSRAIYSEGETLDLFDLAAGSTTVIKGFQGFVGASEDAKTIYFVSTKEVAEGATSGQRNLYRYDAEEPGSFKFVATLAESDVLTSNSTPSAAAPAPYRHTSRVTPDGNAVAFTSAATPTGYDNTDVQGGHADVEVYLYRANADPSLVCVSCLRGGARPSGHNVDDELRSLPLWVSGQIPAAEGQLDTSRVLSADGSRLFFESFDALSPRDTNSKKDVYEWERQGAGNCTAGAPGFDPAAGGCVNLISAGSSDQGSTIVDASPSGRDVFFKTESSLLPQDTEAVDIYDARADGGFPIAEAPPTPCSGECQGAASAPNGPQPASNQPQASGNLQTVPCRKGTHRTTKHGRNRCVKNGRKAKAKKKQHRKKPGRGGGRAGR